jgi:ketosteroid isomerase-like protein
VTVEQNITLITEYFDSMNAGDMDRAFTHFSDSAVWWSNVQRVDIPIKEFKRFAKQAFERMPARFEIHDIWGKQDRVVAECQSFAMQSNGKPYHNVYCFLFTIDDIGKIQKGKMYADTREMADLPSEMTTLHDY